MQSYIDKLLSGKALTKKQEQIRDLVINSDSEDEPPIQPIKEPYIPPIQPIKKVNSNQSMEDYINSMINHEDVINSPSEIFDKLKAKSEPEPEPELFKEPNQDLINKEYIEKIEERHLRVKSAQERFERSIPKLVFIVPYRDKYAEKDFYMAQMLKVLEDYPDTYYKIYYIHQNDNRQFNRGAMKNIGFLILKNKYPSYYKDITLVFNDIDVMPY